MGIGDFVWADDRDDYYYYPATIQNFDGKTFKYEIHFFKGNIQYLEANELRLFFDAAIPVEYFDNGGWIKQNVVASIDFQRQLFFIFNNQTNQTFPKRFGEIRTNYFPSIRQ